MKKHWAIVIVLILSAVIRLYRLDYPTKYYFDEVYHVVSAKAYAVNNPAGYEWWHKAPEPGTAYEWLHPPIAKLFMALGIVIFGESSWSWRFPGVVFGVGVIGLVYWLGIITSKKKWVGLVAAIFASLDGLLLSQSRIGMNDIYVTFFMLAAVAGYILAQSSQIKNKVVTNRWWWFSGIMTGLAVSTKWSGVFVCLMVLVWEMGQWRMLRAKWWKRVPRLIATYLLLPAIIYVLSYGQFWLQGHTLGQFKELHEQIWWYQTNLKATHSYQSKAWEWPLMIKPVWYFVDYLDDGKVANIYNIGNPILLWFGLMAQISILIKLVTKIKKPTKKTSAEEYWLIGYLMSWTPWLLSPRIMFFYHYIPAIPFLALGLATWCEKHKDNGTLGKWMVGLIGVSIAITFVWLLPIWIGLPLSKEGLNLRFWLTSWR